MRRAILTLALLALAATAGAATYEECGGGDSDIEGTDAGYTLFMGRM